MTTKKEYCTQNNGDCATCSLVSYDLDCANNPLPRLETDSKWQRALSTYNGWYGPATIACIERNIAAVWPTAYTDLTGKPRRDGR